MTLLEELKDIPAVPKNIHLTDYQSLYYILSNGLQGKEGGYDIHAKITGDDDQELCTTRNTHKLSDWEKAGLSENATGGVRIELFTDRILTGHRGTKLRQIAEYPIYSKRKLSYLEQRFKTKWGFYPPNLLYGPKHKFFNSINEAYRVIKKWVKNNHPEKYKNEDALSHLAVEIDQYNSLLNRHYRNLENREREERFILKSPIPAIPEFMKIVIEELPNGYQEQKFLDTKYAKDFLPLVERHKDVFQQDKNFELFLKYLRDREEKNERN